MSGLETNTSPGAPQSRRSFIRRVAVAAAMGVPAVKALAAASPSRGANTPIAGRYPVYNMTTGRFVDGKTDAVRPNYIECSECAWIDIGGDPCCCLCQCESLNCGLKRGCYDIRDGAICACACGTYCPCCGNGCIH